MRTTMSGIFVCAMAVMATSTRTYAQSAPAAVGERVRIETPTQRDKFRYVGRVTALANDTLQLQTDGSAGLRLVPIAEIRSLEVSAGRTTHGREGMLYGGIGGAVLGGVLGAATYRKPRCNNAIFCAEPDVGRGGDALAGAILGGVLGFAVGGIWGVSHATERWIRRPLGSAGSLSVVPARHGGARVRLNMAFQGHLSR